MENNEKNTKNARLDKLLLAYMIIAIAIIVIIVSLGIIINKTNAPLEDKSFFDTPSKFYYLKR